MFLFVYSSYHLNCLSSSAYMVVILTTLEIPKNIFCVNNNIVNNKSKQDHPGKNITNNSTNYLHIIKK